jgi:hypothetical protein
MSMICCLIDVAEAQINELPAAPDSIHNFVDVWFEGEEVRGIDLDKAWRGIHFLLNESAREGNEPLCYLVKGGEEIGDEDVGYCRARALRPNQIADWADALSAISVDDRRKRFDPEALLKADIYPSVWDRAPEEDDTPGYLLEFYDALRSFPEQTKHENKGAIITLS